MRSCAHCGHANADHLPYCAACGKRLRPLGGGQTPAPRVGSGLTPAPEAGSPGFAATVALGPSRPGPVGTATPATPAPVASRAPAWARSKEAVAYVFATIRGRIDAEEQRRALTSEREGARRMAESTLAELGHAVLVQGIEAPALRELTEAAARLKKRREAVAVDLAAAEKFQAAEDLRLGLLEASIETECKAYDQSVREVEQTLARHTADRQTEEAARDQGPARSASASEKVKQDEQQRALRERAAALRASSLAARARLEQAGATRRHSAAAIAASVAGHTRERAAIEEEARALTSRIGARALQLRLPSPHLLPGYERYDRLQETIRTQEMELARLERSRGGVDRRKLALGLGVIGASLGVVSAGLWALLR
jgi:hypothetical protein